MIVEYRIPPKTYTVNVEIINLNDNVEQRTIVGVTRVYIDDKGFLRIILDEGYQNEYSVNYPLGRVMCYTVTPTELAKAETETE